MRPLEWEERPPWLAAGRLEGMGLPDLLWAIHVRSMTGVLEVFHATVRKTVYLRDGSVIFAGQELAVRRPRVRGLDKKEVRLGSYSAFRQDGRMQRATEIAA